MNVILGYGEEVRGLVILMINLKRKKEQEQLSR